METAARTHAICVRAAPAQSATVSPPLRSMNSLMMWAQPYEKIMNESGE